ncbi:cysteine--tRNA ligase [Spirochaetia bacterium]|nr:cysteine--tRNA ligase [Spirochaetia bacterium]GHU31657.1 cysteine--tRNA ligase [Spirochaetia bacterium]
MPLKLFNTLGREIQVFEPFIPGKVGFYGCGPTVYNYAHIGNLRAYLTHDILVRTLRRRGFEVCHVMNITDVGHLSGDNDTGEDKMLKTAEERGKSVLEVADFYTSAFFNDMDRLNIVRPTVIPKATEHIADMIALIKRIEDAGFTYFAGGNLYFDITRFPAYGELARLGDQRAGARTDLDESKRNAGDFVLWFTKSKFENQALLWDSPWGRGYPGWHIECSAMSMKYLGEQFDIHAGGIDHIPVHHTNEIAQSETATGKHPWVKYWLHNEFLVLDKGKMSKSAGKFLTLQHLIDSGYDPLDLRYFLLGAHYRSPLQFSFQALDGAKNSRKSLMDHIRRIHSEEKPGSHSADSYLENFESALDDDLSTPRALAALWGLIRDSSSRNILDIVVSMDRVLGLNLMQNLGKSESDPEIEALVAERSAAKKAKDFAKADSIRQDLQNRGISLEDRPSGTIWRRN